MLITPAVGGRSRSPSRNPCLPTRRDHRVRRSRGERGIWQRRYWEHTIRDDRDYAAHMDYTHFNPVKHCLATHPADWPFSSFRHCVAVGLYPADWLGDGNAPSEAGERRPEEAEGAMLFRPTSYMDISSCFGHNQNI
jgi:hypothetical protein